MDYIAHIQGSDGLVSLSLIKDGSVSAGFYEWGHHGSSQLQNIKYALIHF